MKRIGILAVAVALVASAQTDPARSMRTWSDAQSLTESAPTVVTEGLSINDTEGYRVTVCADSGQTLSGAGSLQAYYWDNTISLWVRTPALDFPTSTASVRCLNSPDFQVMVAGGRVFYAATAVTVSSGTVTVYVKAWTKRGELR